MCNPIKINGFSGTLDGPIPLNPDGTLAGGEGRPIPWDGPLALADLVFRDGLIAGLEPMSEERIAEVEADPSYRGRELRRVQRSAFTLVELLVVIAIIGTLVSLLLPAVQKVREAANRTQCQSNLRQLGVALLNFHTDHRSFPPGSTHVPSTATAMYGWTAQILPYIEQGNIKVDLTKDWTAGDATGINATRLNLLRCPSAPAKRNETTRSATDYSAANLPNNDGILYSAPLGETKGIPIRDITDGASNTILLAECAGRPLAFVNGLAVGSDAKGAWADPSNMIIVQGSDPTTGKKPGACAANCTNAEEVYAFHPGVANLLFADGSVRPFSASTKLSTLQALITRDGGETIGGF